MGQFLSYFLKLFYHLALTKSFTLRLLKQISLAFVNRIKISWEWTWLGSLVAMDKRHLLVTWISFDLAIFSLILMFNGFISESWFSEPTTLTRLLFTKHRVFINLIRLNKVEVVSAWCGSIVEIAVQNNCIVFVPGAFVTIAEFPVPGWQALRAKARQLLIFISS